MVPEELPMAVFPVPEERVVAPVEVVLKLPEVMVRLFPPREIEEALKPERLSVPLVAVRLSAPDERVNPLEAVSNWVAVR
jgi:hypothetical protein